MSTTNTSKLIDNAVYADADEPKDPLAGTYLEDFKGGEGGGGGGPPPPPPRRIRGRI